MISKSTITDNEFNQLRNYIEESCGIALGEDKSYLIETRLTKLMTQSGCSSFGEFYNIATQKQDTTLRDKIVDAMTTNETLWFRDKHPYKILSEKILPTLADQIEEGKRSSVRIWSAACSTGQEPYSIAITIQEFCKRRSTVRPDQFKILGTDISSSALFIAKTGRYDRLAMNRGIDEEIRNRYFKQEGMVWILNDSIRQMVTFQKFNLQDAFFTLGSFDVVFLRYVAIYFSESFKKSLFARIANLLKPAGFLIIGGVESLRGLSDEFKIHTYENGSYYAI